MYIYIYIPYLGVKSKGREGGERESLATYLAVTGNQTGDAKGLVRHRFHHSTWLTWAVGARANGGFHPSDVDFD